MNKTERLMDIVILYMYLFIGAGQIKLFDNLWINLIISIFLLYVLFSIVHKYIFKFNVFIWIEKLKKDKENETKNSN